MVVDKCIGRCLDVGSTPTGSIKAFHSLVKFSKTLIYQRFFIFLFCLVCVFESLVLGSLVLKKLCDLKRIVVQ